jgi:hypothetical protein
VHEIVEFRIPEENAKAFLPAAVGKYMGYGVRKVEVSTDDPLFKKIGELHRVFRKEGRYFFYGRIYNRYYTQTELEQAPFIQLIITKMFEPAGEEHGTVYDESKACHICGGGAPQITPLCLPYKCFPKKSDFAKTIAGEIIVSIRAVEAFRTAKLKGVEFHPILLSGSNQIQSTDFYQLMIVGSKVDIHPSTKFGEDPFDDSNFGRCPQRDTLGLNLLSEITIKAESV